MASKDVFKSKVEKKEGHWTDGQTVEKLQVILQDVLASENHWFLRKGKNNKELEKSDGDSCSFCIRLKSKSGCIGCPILLREGQTCSSLDAYITWTKHRKNYCCLSHAALASIPMWKYLITMMEEVKKVLTEKLLKVGERIRVRLDSGTILTGKISNVNLTGEDRGRSGYTYDLNRDDGHGGSGKNESYRLYHNLLPIVMKEETAEEKKIKLRDVAVGKRVKVTSDIEKNANCTGVVVTVGGEANDFVIDIKRDNNRGGVGCGGSYRVYKEYEVTIVVITDADQIEILKSEVRLLKTKLKDADDTLFDIALFVEKGRVETNMNLEKLYGQVSDVRRSLRE